MASLVAAHDLSIRRVCGAVTAHPRWGFWKFYDRLRLDDKPWNHKRVLRAYREMRLNLPRRTKERVPRQERQTLEVPEAPNAIWALDFMSDALYHGRRYRMLNVIDEGVREALDIVIDTSIPGGRVVRTLEQLSRWRGLPEAIRCDNGPEMISQAFVEWCKTNEVEIRYIQPGKPNQNAYIERFNRTYREEVLDAHLFDTLSQVVEATYRWLQTYHETRPHDAWGESPRSSCGDGWRRWKTLLLPCLLDGEVYD